MSAPLVESRILSQEDYDRLTGVINDYSVEQVVIAINEVYKNKILILTRNLIRVPKFSLPVSPPDEHGQNLVEKTFVREDAILLVHAALSVTIGERRDPESNGSDIGGS